MSQDKVIATRTLTLQGRPEENFVIRVFKPEPDEQNYRCEFEVDGKRSYSMGVDEMQALFGALQLIGNRLYTSTYWKAGKLTWLDGRDLGFPVANGRADYLPE